MYEDPDECIFVTEKILENRGDGTTGTLSSGQLNEDPNESVHIIYENVKCYPEVLIVKEVGMNRNSDMEANPVESIVEPINLSIPPVNAKKQRKAKTSKATSVPIASISTPPINEMEQNKKSSEATSSTGTTVECGICLETPREVSSSDKMLMSTVCGHIFCNLCITRSLKESKFCPKCRKPYLAKGRRQDLLELAETLGVSIDDTFKVLDIKDAIVKSQGYDADFAKECLNRIISDRKELELRAERETENQRIFELQKLQITTNISTTADSALMSSSADSNMPKLELHKLLPVFDPVSFPSQSRRETGVPSNSRWNPISNDRMPETKIVDTKEDRPPVSCYGCGTPGVIRSRCHTCNPVRQKDDALSSSLNQSHFYSFSSENNPISIIQISICDTKAAVCADSGATHSVAGEKLYHLLKQKGLNFNEKTMQMTLADGRTQTTEILTTSVDITIQGKVIPTELIVLKNARGNRTLLGVDFLTAAGIVLDLQRKLWYFTETSHRKYYFVKAHPNINALLTVDPEPHPCQLRGNEGTHLSLQQREEINKLLEKYEECFQPGGEPTPFIEHRINTRAHLPVAVPP
ncbi:transposon Ty3-I Gag-Pol polyprotein [Trichonephila clavata]|uniref:Transposon Ty3-I Gag-Pol polyprotein n=1 Tax=Trichonephila clavata TaxID=2740835 RepID=A0A8X6GBX9_TRICU|nr:transposon Ty3-I Gag-Pol polyprotein [Trichonephila clavata]